LRHFSETQRRHFDEDHRAEGLQNVKGARVFIASLHVVKTAQGVRRLGHAVPVAEPSSIRPLSTSNGSARPPSPIAIDTSP
jgi:hypothetical protein